MTGRALICVLIAAGCTKAGAPGDLDLSTPVAAARCEAGAIRAKDAARWKACWHPDTPGLDAEMAKAASKPGFWDRAAKGLPMLERATAADFKIEPMPAERAAWGDQHASLRLVDDSLELARKDGRWYIVDSGV
jgi:hypothetical protein